MRIFLAALLLALMTAGLATVPADAQDKPPAGGENPAPPVDPKHQRAWNLMTDRLADVHCGFGKKYVKVDAIAEAIAQYRFALWLKPDEDRAWKGLGYVKKDGAWIAEKPLLEDEVDPDKLPPEERKKYDEKQKKIIDECIKLQKEVDAAHTKAVKDLIKFHGEAQAGGAADLVKKAGYLLGWYGPLAADAAKVRGLEPFDGKFLHPSLVAANKSARKALDAAPEGTKLDGVDEQAEALGWKPFNRRKLDGRPWIIRTTWDEDRAKKLMKIAASSEDLVKALLGADKAPRFPAGGTFTFTECRNKTEYGDFVRKFDDSDEKRKEFILKLSGTSTKTPWGFITWSLSGDDMAAHNMAASCLSYTRGVNGDPWVTRGFGYMVTGQMLGTTHTRFYTLGRSGRTSDVRASEADLKRKRDGTPERLRVIAAEMICLDRDIPFRILSKTEINDMTEQHVAKAMTMFEMLNSRHPKEMRAWLMREKPKADDDFGELIKALGTDEDALQAMWVDWVLGVY